MGCLKLGRILVPGKQGHITEEEGEPPPTGGTQFPTLTREHSIFLQKPVKNVMFLVQIATYKTPEQCF